MRRVLAFVLVLTGMVGAGCQSPGQQPAAPLVIGADLELTGPDGPVGTTLEQAIRLKVDQLNAQGGRRVELVVKDNRSDPGTSAANLAELAADHRVAAAVTGVCSSCAVAAAQRIDAVRLPMLSLAPAQAIINPTMQRRYAFKVAPNPADDSAALVADLVRAGVHTIGLISVDDPYGDDGQQAMAHDAAKAGITVLAKEKFPTTGDVEGAAKKMAAKGPEAVVIWSLSPPAGRAAKALRDAKYAGRLYLDAAAAGELFLTDSAASVDSARLVFTPSFVIDDVIATTPAKAAQKQWFRDYTTRYGTYAGPAAFAADAVQLVATAAVRAGDDRDRLRAVIETTQLDGLSGPIRMTPDNHSGLMPQALTILVARDNRWRLAGT